MFTSLGADSLHSRNYTSLQQIRNQKVRKRENWRLRTRRLLVCNRDRTINATAMLAFRFRTWHQVTLEALFYKRHRFSCHSYDVLFVISAAVIVVTTSQRHSVLFQHQFGYSHTEKR